MNLISALNELARVLEVTIGTEDGRTVFHNGKSSADDVNAASIICGQNLKKSGDALGLGSLVDFSLQGKDSTIIVARDEKVATVKVAGKTDAKKVRQFLLNEQWTMFDPASLSERSPNVSAAPGKAGPLKKDLPPLKGLNGLSSKQGGPAASLTNKSAPQKNTPPLAVPKKKAPVKSGGTGDTRQPKPAAAGSTKPRSTAIPPGAAGKPKKTRTTSIPATPASRTLALIRISLFTGDVTEANVQQAKLIEYNCFADRQKEQSFVSLLKALCSVITQLLDNDLSVQKRLVAIHEKSAQLDASLEWAVLVWQCRINLAQGKLDTAEEVAISAYQLSHEFDYATRAATHCLIAKVYMMANKLEGALKILRTGRKFAERSKTDILIASIALMEAQIYSVVKNFNRGTQAAQEASQKFPHSAYPKIIQARIAVLNNQSAEAAKLYDDILSVNSKQPDALVDKSIVALLESKSIKMASVETYFNLREMAPSTERIAKMKELLSQLPNFVPLRNLLVWRLIGIGEINTARFLYQPDSDHTHKNRFKPNILIGYSDSAIVATRYVDADKFIASLPGSDAASDVESAIKAAFDSSVPCLSLPPENILKMLETDVAEKLISGELEAFSMPDLLEFLRNAKRTGILFCSSDDGVGAIVLTEGFVTSAIVPNVDNIGTLLLQKGKVTRARLSEAIKAKEKDISGARIGAILVNEGIVDAETIKQALIEQTFSAIRTMLKWTNGRFVFTPSSPENSQPTRGIELKLDARFVLMEIFRELDESDK